MYLDESKSLTIGQPISVELESGTYQCRMYGMVIDVSASRNGQYMVHDVYIVSYETDADELEFWQILYDRVPSLPQSLKNDFGALAHLWRNIAFRIANTVRS